MNICEWINKKMIAVMTAVYLPKHSDENLVKSDLWNKNNTYFGHGSCVRTLAYDLLAADYGADLSTFWILSFIISKMEIIHAISLIELLQEINKIICRKVHWQLWCVNVSLQILFIHHLAQLHTRVQILPISLYKVHADVKFLSFNSSLFRLAAKFLS